MTDGAVNASGAQQQSWARTKELEAEVERLRALLKWAHDLDKFQGEFPPIRWYDEVARYFKGQAPSDLTALPEDR